MSRARTLLDRAAQRLDAIPTHSVVIAALAVIAVSAVLATLLGGLDYDPVALLASAATSVVITVIIAQLTGMLFRAPAHTPSAVITGLLLFMVLPPGGTARGLLTLVVAGAVAGASRFLLAWRGRHLFNPAAIAAVVVGITQLGASTWWVATPVLLPVVVITGAIVLIRVRRLRLAAVFAVLAFAISTGRMLGFGMAPADAMWTAIASFPMLFTAAFMLTEPQSLPPRRWQRLLVAAATAVLFAVPFQLGPIYSSPELALVLGNLIAFGFGQRRMLRLELVERRRMSPTSWEFTFDTPADVRRAAGQYVEIALPHARTDARGSRRVFTIASPPGEPVVIGTRMSEPLSSFKRALDALPTGATVRGTRVGGDFLLPGNRTEPLLLIAAGIGITPFLAQLPELVGRDAVLVYAAAGADELAWAPRIAATGIPVVTVLPEAPIALPDGWRTLVGELSGGLIAEAVPDLDRRRAYLAGRPETVRRLRRELREAGVRTVRVDRFDGA